MNEPDFEQQLRAARLAAPSFELDRRMDGLFATPVAPGQFTTIRQWFMLGLPAAAAAAAIVLYSLRPEPPAAPRLTGRIVYQVDPRGLMREWLLTPPAKSQTPPVMIVTLP